MKQRSPLFFLFITVFIDLLGAGMILPLLPFYVKIIETAETQWLVQNQALVIGLLTASFSLMQFLFAPILGSLSDRVGRRPVLLISLLGTGVSYVMLGFADQLLFLGAEVVIATLFFARILDGITGGNISTAQAYIADVTAPEERARGLGMIGAAFGLGFLLGPAFGGLLSTISLQLPAFVAATICFANVIFGFFVLPESLSVEQRSAAGSQNNNPFRKLANVLSYASIRPILAAVLLLNLAFAGLQSNFAVYSNVRFAFGPSENAFGFALIGLIAVIVQGFLLRRLVARFGEARLALTGLAVMSVAFTAIALAPSGAALVAALGLLASGSGLATPSLTSLISRRVSQREQGTVLGGVQAFTSLAMVGGPILAGFAFDSLSPLAPYLGGSALVVTATLMAILALRPDLRTQPTLQSVEQPIEQPLVVE